MRYIPFIFLVVSFFCCNQKKIPELSVFETDINMMYRTSIDSLKNVCEKGDSNLLLVFHNKLSIMNTSDYRVSGLDFLFSKISLTSNDTVVIQEQMYTNNEYSFCFQQLNNDSVYCYFYNRSLLEPKRKSASANSIELKTDSKLGFYCDKIYRFGFHPHDIEILSKIYWVSNSPKVDIVNIIIY